MYIRQKVSTIRFILLCLDGIEEEENTSNWKLREYFLKELELE